jgi:hypothetical protein
LSRPGSLALRPVHRHAGVLAAALGWAPGEVDLFLGVQASGLVHDLVAEHRTCERGHLVEATDTSVFATFESARVGA